MVPNFYYQDTSFLDLLQDFAGEIFGAFFFMFFFLIVTETNYMAGEYFRYMLISVMYLAGRVYHFDDLGLLFGSDVSIPSLALSFSSTLPLTEVISYYLSPIAYLLS